MNKKIYVYLFSVLVVLLACKKELSPDMQKVVDCETAYNKSPNKETAAAYVAASLLYSSAHPKDDESIEMLIKAKDFTKQQKQSVVNLGLTNELIKQYPKDRRIDSWFVEMITGMDKMGRQETANTLRYFKVKADPNFAKKINYTLPSGIQENPKDFLKSKAEAIFVDPDKTGINRKASYSYVDACEAYVLVNPQDPEASNLLFYASQITKTVGSFTKTLKIFDWIISKYPNSKEAPEAQFLKAFILEENIKNLEAAREHYKIFIEKYPNHHYHNDAKFSLKNLGKSGEEIQKELRILQEKELSKNK